MNIRKKRSLGPIPPEDFIADHPIIYAIIENDIEMPLFIGTIYSITEQTQYKSHDEL